MKRKHKAALGCAVGLATGGGIATALWSAGASGAAGATAISARAVTVNAATGTADLYPGFGEGDLTLALTNPNPYPVEFTEMTPGAIVSSDPSACPPANVTVDPASGLALSVAANATSATATISDVVTMAASAPDGCQGVSFSVTLQLSGSQL